MVKPKSRRKPRPQHSPGNEIAGMVQELRGCMSDEEIKGAVGCSLSAISMWAYGHRANKTGRLMLNLFRLHAEKCQKAAA